MNSEIVGFVIVTPVETGVHSPPLNLDAGLRRHDELVVMPHQYN